MNDKVILSSTNSADSGGDRPLAFEFALLGLRSNEARRDVISRAASNLAGRILENAEADPEETNELLADVALSAYRLLDPRQRVKSLERIQLCIMTESDLEHMQEARKPLVIQPASLQASRDAHELRCHTSFSSPRRHDCSH